MKKGDLVVYADQETMPEFANSYGIVINTHWHGDVRLCRVWWTERPNPTIHYKHELEILKQGNKNGEYILEQRG